MNMSVDAADKLRDAEDALWEEKRALYEEAAKERLKTRLFQPAPDQYFDRIKVLLEWWMDDFPESIWPDRADFEAAITARNREAIGQHILDSLERTADKIVESEQGQMKVDDIINEMWEDGR